MLDLTLFLEFLRGNWEGLFWMFLVLGLLQLPMMLLIWWDNRPTRTPRVDSTPRWVDPATAVTYRWNRVIKVWEADVDGEHLRRTPGVGGAPAAPSADARPINYANPTVFSNGHAEKRRPTKWRTGGSRAVPDEGR